MNINQGWERVREYAGFGGMTISLIAIGLGFGLVGCFVSDEEDKRTTRLIEGDLSVAKNENERFYALNGAAKNALAAGKTRDAIKLAEELEKLAPKYQDDWNYGNAVQVANHVLGRIALSKGDVAEAKKRLLASADSEGSPQMNSFGPNMQLARELLAKGERDTVLKYFELCRKFWMMGGGSLDRWTQEVKAGKTPDFGANLSY
ncbi:MAG: tetratricopeptide repeat protein [Limisphaerales bacterium]